MATMMRDPTGNQANGTNRHIRRYGLIGALLIVAALLLISCGGGTPKQAAAPAPSGPAAPDVKAQTLEGEQFSLAQQHGKPVLLLFMASWCTTCIPGAKDINQLTKTKDGQDLSVLVVDADAHDTPGALSAFRQQIGGPSKYWAVDSKGQITQAFAVKALDTTILIDRQGHIAYRNETRQSLTTLTQQVASLR
jgi:peroxiredoxin